MFYASQGWNTSLICVILGWEPRLQKCRSGLNTVMKVFYNFTAFCWHDLPGLIKACDYHINALPTPPVCGFSPLTPSCALSSPVGALAREREPRVRRRRPGGAGRSRPQGKPAAAGRPGTAPPGRLRSPGHPSAPAGPAPAASEGSRSCAPAPGPRPLDAGRPV